MTEVTRYDPCNLIITTPYLVVTQNFEIKTVNCFGFI